MSEDAEVKYPVAEIFTSFQGEGLYAGTVMTFIRLAGCNVGKRYPASYYDKLVESAVPGVISDLPIYTDKCTTWDGREFPCDTDYRKKMSLTADEILEQVPAGVEHICITGGEPLLHNLKDIYDSWIKSRPLVMHEPSFHVETSGTRPVLRWMLDGKLRDSIWITVSPKLGFLLEVLLVANELKFLVDENFKEENIEAIASYFDGGELVYLQPINNEHTINKKNEELCKKIILEKHPTWRMSSQLHKYWEVR